MSDCCRCYTGSTLRRATLIKSNQSDGADLALRCARFWRKPLLARCGYMWSKNKAIENGADSPIARRALAIEKRVFTAAERIAVTTPEMRASIQERFAELDERIHVVPNYVETDRFYPTEEKGSGPFRLCFVGRLSPEKNLEALIDAAMGLDLDLELIGQGPLEHLLKRRATGHPRIQLSGRVPNNELPERMRAATAFVLPSLYEGHSKTLIEAMACGLPCIATNVSGNREVVEHGKTGWLCGTDAFSLREGIDALINDPGLRERLGREARAAVLERYALDRVVAQELDVLRQVAGG